MKANASIAAHVITLTARSGLMLLPSPIHFAMGCKRVYIDVRICLRAAFSNLDTCACEIPISSATSI